MKDNQIIKTAVKALDSKKAKDLKVIKISDVSSLANYFVLSSGTSSTHVKTLADEIESQLSLQGLEPKRTEGYNGANWIILDYIDVIIHVFHEETRNFYDLERLWLDGKTISQEELETLS